MGVEGGADLALLQPIKVQLNSIRQFQLALELLLSSPM